MNKRIVIVALITFILDQVSKIVIESLIEYHHSVTIIKNFFKLTIVHNFGISWGILEGQRVLIIIGTLIVMLVVYKLLLSFESNLRNNIAFGLLIGGMFGNFIDRLFFGYVRDFLDFKIFNYKYPVFNIGDMGIVIGIILIIIATIKGEDESDNKSKE
jgi:signal peptidase II